MEKGDTIAAIATGMTDSGIGIVRISGSGAVDVGNRIFRSPSGKRILSRAQSHKLCYGFAVEQDNGFEIDEVMAVVMKAPRSFTGEDTVELQCHGGVFVMRKILEAALKGGARLAEPGEFTKRAFLNGRMDLSRAEAVMDVIGAQNDRALGYSLGQLRGRLSGKVEELRGRILYETAFIESALDDPEHYDLDGYGEELSGKLDGVLRDLRKLIDTADNGKLIKEGIKTVILGKPNVGKSSLLNCLLGEERAIVTDVAGTTRDVLEESLRLGDICLNIVDTAGIRDTEDTVEKIGVERALKYAREADLIVYVTDASMELDENDREIVSVIRDKSTIVLLNKSDLETVVTEDGIKALFLEATGDLGDYFSVDSSGKNKFAVLHTSAKESAGMEELEQTVKEMFFHGEIDSSNELVITNMRHKEALEEACEALMLVQESIEDGMPEDFYSIDLMNAYRALGRIIGEEVDDDLVEEIFSKFCMGK
jgi:tRNA modification GTPase|nr:tRNA uridine-5-carboxymethylaminomethyl(34) synthesis GTPase MnmE [uncultured Acetatifactor sp.]